MGSEERWAQQQEWNEEKRKGFDIEINRVIQLYGETDSCHAFKCNLPAVKRYEIKKVAAPGEGIDIDLCEDHDDEETAFELYREEIAHGLSQ